MIRGAEDRIIDDAAETLRKSLTPNEQIYHDIDYAKLTGDQLVKSSGKFVLLSKVRQFGGCTMYTFVCLVIWSVGLNIFSFRLEIISCFQSCLVADIRCE